MSAAFILAGGFVGLLIVIGRSSYVTRAEEFIEQPIQFSHLHHVGDDGIDCRYCHTSVETSPFAGIPPTKTCMNCHSQIWSTAPILEPVRASFRDDRPLRWIRVHDLPDFVYFNHSIHVKKGMGCETCHGRVDEMPLMLQENSLQMEWCLTVTVRRSNSSVREARCSRWDTGRRCRSRCSGRKLVNEYAIQSLHHLFDVPSVMSLMTAPHDIDATAGQARGAPEDGNTGAASKRSPKPPNSKSSCTASSLRTRRSGSIRWAAGAS